jgi:hypothetical protein
MGCTERLDRIPEYAGSWFPPTDHLPPCGEELVIRSEEGDFDASFRGEWIEGTNRPWRKWRG